MKVHLISIKAEAGFGESKYSVDYFAVFRLDFNAGQAACNIPISRAGFDSLKKRINKENLGDEIPLRKKEFFLYTGKDFGKRLIAYAKDFVKVEKEEKELGHCSFLYGKEWEILSPFYVTIEGEEWEVRHNLLVEKPLLKEEDRKVLERLIEEHSNQFLHTGRNDFRVDARYFIHITNGSEVFEYRTACITDARRLIEVLYESKSISTHVHLWNFKMKRPIDVIDYK